MIDRKILENTLFLDIETVSVVRDFDSLDQRLKEHWEHKTNLLQKTTNEKVSPSEFFPQRAAIFAEFGKVVCISCGYLRWDGLAPVLKLKSYNGENETELLASFAEMLEKYSGGKDRWLCAHNGKEFDFPYLCRRYLIHGMKIPPLLSDLQGKKPWEVRVLDTMELWKFGDYKAYTSLDLLTTVLGVPSPKSDMDGSDVGRVYYEEKDYTRIMKYCEEDVIATAQVMMKFSGIPLIKAENISHGS